MLELCEREVSGETRALCEGAGRRQWRLVPLVSRCDALQGAPCPASSSDSSVGLINLGKLGRKRPTLLESFHLCWAAEEELVAGLRPWAGLGVLDQC